MSTTAPPRLSDEDLEAFGAEIDALRQRVFDDLGEKDVQYIRRVMRAQSLLAVGGRGLLFFSFLPPAWFAGVGALAASKIIDNMEIGHNVMHGQYDWTGDPHLSGHLFEWDNACPSEQWRHTHNYRHHTFTNILGEDADIGWGVLRLSARQKWHPYYLGNVITALLLASFFQYGVAVYDIESDYGATPASKRQKAASVWRKVRQQTLKDYVLFPALAGPQAPLVFAGNASANLIRNVWAFMIIACGHFPEGAVEFTQEEVERETRAGWYLRQIVGSVNLTGSKLFHIMTGNLSHHVEHHLFPDIPSCRYEEISSEIREICENYGIPYNEGPLSREFAMVLRKVVRMSFPGGDGSGSRGAQIPRAAVGRGLRGAMVAHEQAA